MTSAHYVCDKCGAYWSSRLPYSRCRYCKHSNIWQYTRPIAAIEHAAHIKERRRVFICEIDESAGLAEESRVRKPEAVQTTRRAEES